MKTNPAYAHLAYRKAIYTEVIALVRRKFLPDETGQSSARLMCEDVMFCDAEVPQEEFQYFLNELETERAGFDLEMRKFEFVRNDAQQQPQGSQSQDRNQQKGRKGRS